MNQEYSHVKRILSAHEKLQETKTKFLRIQFLQIHKIVLGMCFMAYLGIVDIEFISDYSFQLAFDIC